MNISRRRFVLGTVAAAGALAAAPLLTLGKSVNAPYKFTPVRMMIGGGSSLAEGSSLFFFWPTNLRPLDVNVLIRDKDGKFYAYNRICTHLQCMVNYNPKTSLLECPCHGSSFDPATGDVVGGPAPRPLPKIVLETGTDGQLYAVDVVGTFGFGR